MIFNFALVCTQFLFGICLTTFLVRKHNLLGAGFYWLMYSVGSIFALLALISVDDNKIVATIVLISTLGSLLFSIIKRKTVKENHGIKYELIVSLNIVSIVLLMFLIVDQADVINPMFELLRALIGALTIGGITTAMLVGHWYLVQPGISRAPLIQLSNYGLVVVIINIILWLISPSMIQVISGEISDGWGGTLAYMWIGASVTTIILLIAAKLSLKEKSYTAVMATTGLLYLSILMATGLELIPRSILN